MVGRSAVVVVVRGRRCRLVIWCGLMVALVLVGGHSGVHGKWVVLQLRVDLEWSSLDWGVFFKASKNKMSCLESTNKFSYVI